MLADYGDDLSHARRPRPAPNALRARHPLRAAGLAVAAGLLVFAAVGQGAANRDVDVTGSTRMVSAR